MLIQVIMTRLSLTMVGEPTHLKVGTAPKNKNHNGRLSVSVINPSIWRGSLWTEEGSKLFSYAYTKRMEEGLLVKEREVKAERLTWGLIGQEMKRLCCVAGPMMAVTLCQFLLQVISLMMVGHLGELSLSSSAIAISLCAVTGFSLLVSSLYFASFLGLFVFFYVFFFMLAASTFFFIFCLPIIFFYSFFVFYVWGRRN